jgi:hypothetical protein
MQVDLDAEGQRGDRLSTESESRKIALDAEKASLNAANEQNSGSPDANAGSSADSGRDTDQR